jgi:transcriptional regulator with XRE-family HTH domain
MPAKTAARSPSAFDATVGRNVRVWRMARGLSQKQLAGRLGISFQQVQKYESGGDRIAMGRLVKVARILGVPVSFLFFGTGGRDSETAGLLELIADSRSFRLAHAFAAINKSALRLQLVALVEKVAAASQGERRRK